MVIVAIILSSPWERADLEERRGWRNPALLGCCNSGQVVQDVQPVGDGHDGHGDDDVLGGGDGDVDGGDNGDDESADSNANCKLHWTLSSAVDRHAIAKS